MEELVKWLNDRTKEYDEGHPTVSDYEWDKAYFKLQNLEAEEGRVLPDSPTHRIKYEAVNELKKVKHNHPMLSADKTKDWNEFINYFGEHDVIGMLKLDGLTCSLRYINGRLVSAETRGNGEEGEDILHNAIVIPSIPKIIDYGDELIIDGEIICTKKDFEPFAADYKNPRNFASGSIRLLNPNECKNRKLTFVAWNIVKGLHNNSFIKKLEIIDNLGFTVVPHISSFNWDAKEFLIEQADKLGYPIDGLVGRFDDIAYGESLGATGHHTKAIYAFKMYDEEVESTLVDITYDVSRQGILTPVAVFEPIDLDGSTIERASLHNISIMTETLHGPGWVGQKVKVYKANQIIPQISDAEDDNKEVEKVYFKRPVCPICGAESILKTSDAGVKILYCPNEQCEGKLAQKIDHFLSLKGINAKGVSRKTIEFLIDKDWIKELKDVFNLESYRSIWKTEPGWGDASVKKILDGIGAARNCTLEGVLAGAGIPLIGSRVAKDISSRVDGDYGKFKDLINAGFHFSEWAGYGIEMENALLGFDYDELDYIVENYLVIEAPKAVSSQSAGNGDLAGKTFVITGKLSRRRNDIIADIEAVGGKVTGSVSAKTNYLVCNAVENTAKYNKALQLNIPIITEVELMEMING